MILLYKTNDEEFGYNLSIGTKLSKKHIETIKNNSIGNKNMLGHHHTNEAKEKIRKANLNKIVSEETKKKKSKPVIQYDKTMNKINEFYGIHEASRQTNIYWTCIAGCCSGKRKSAGGFHWCFVKEE